MTTVGPGWDWPVAQLIETHDGDTVRLRISCGFDVWAQQWIRLKDVWAPELDEPGGPEATTICQEWFADHAPDGLVKVTTFRTSAPLEVRFRMSFTRYIGIVSALDGTELNRYLIEQGYSP